jgi:hypothetical protein
MPSEGANIRVFQKFFDPAMQLTLTSSAVSAL